MKLNELVALVSVIFEHRVVHDLRDGHTRLRWGSICSAVASAIASAIGPANGLAEGQAASSPQQERQGDEGRAQQGKRGHVYRVRRSARSQR